MIRPLVRPRSAKRIAGEPCVWGGCADEPIPESRSQDVWRRKVSEIIADSSMRARSMVLSDHGAAHNGDSRPISRGTRGMAEELGWPLEDFDKAFGEVSAQGMAKADFQNRVIWIRNALKHNSPASPNVVTSWVAEMDLIPECALKCEAISGIHEFLGTLHPAYLQAFDAILGPGKSSQLP